MAERPTVERPPWEPRTRFEIEREVSQLKSNNKRLGETLGWVVDVMLQDESRVADLDGLRERKRTALESLAYVRDALMGNVGELEDERLFGEAELRKRQLDAEMRASEVCVDVRPPAPASVIDSQSRKTSARMVVPRSAGGELPGALSAPWNHTASSFSDTATRADLPKVPPATSRKAARGSATVDDPLGVSRAGPEITGL
jgi:TBC1 domain family protein 5